jgi:hypothetical protein
MKRIILLPLLSTLLLSQAHADFQSELENVYIKSANTIVHIYNSKASTCKSITTIAAPGIKNFTDF